MPRNPEQIRDVGAVTLVALGSFGLTLSGYFAPSLPWDEAGMMAAISTAVFIGGGALCEKGTRQITKERLSADQVGEVVASHVEYEI